MNISAYLVTCFLGGLAGVFWLLVGFLLFNLMTPKWDFQEVFREKGISGGAFIVAAFLLGLALVVSRVAS
jgi:hypothetical protein